MILRNVAIAGRNGNWHIQIKSGKIASVTRNESELEPGEKIELDQGICLPGFINSHDHLDFNLFPQLKDKIYTNYAEWGPSIQRNHRELIEKVLKVPVALRIKWGLYKNLLNGFTTVVNHGNKLEIEDDLINVFQDYYPLHSPGFEKNWKWKLNNPFKRSNPYVMHLGEGTDIETSAEIDAVIKMNFLKKSIIAVHGVAMRPEQARSFKGLIWCPASNYFLLDQTAAIKELKQRVRIVFGTDSTLTAPWNAWEHFYLVLQKEIVTEDELLAMLVSAPCSLWKMDNRSEIKTGQKADILVLKKSNEIFGGGPAGILLVMKDGDIKMMDEVLLDQLKNPMETFSRILLGDAVKIVKGKLESLTREILKSYPEAQIPFKLVRD